MLQTVTDFKRPFFSSYAHSFEILLFIVVFFSTREENYPYFMMLFGYNLCVCVRKKMNLCEWDFVSFRKKDY